MLRINAARLKRDLEELGAEPFKNHRVFGKSL